MNIEELASEACPRPRTEAVLPLFCMSHTDITGHYGGHATFHRFDFTEIFDRATFGKQFQKSAGTYSNHYCRTDFWMSLALSNEFYLIHSNQERDDRRGMSGPAIPIPFDTKFPARLPRPLWLKIERILPKGNPQRHGGGRRRSSDREILAAYAFLRRRGLGWKDVHLPGGPRISKTTLHRRVKLWRGAGVFERLKDPKYSYFDTRIQWDWWSIFNKSEPHALRERIAPTAIRKQYSYRGENEAPKGGRRQPQGRRGVQVPDVIWAQLRPVIPGRIDGSPASDRVLFNGVVCKFFYRCSWEDLATLGYSNPQQVYRQFVEWRALGVFQKIGDLNIKHRDRSYKFDWKWLQLALPWDAPKEKGLKK